MPIMSIYSMITKYICNFPKRIMEMCITAYSVMDNSVHSTYYGLR